MKTFVKLFVVFVWTILLVIITLGCQYILTHGPDWIVSARTSPDHRGDTLNIPIFIVWVISSIGISISAVTVISNLETN